MNKTSMSKLVMQMILIIASGDGRDLTTRYTCSNNQSDWATYLSPNPTSHGYTLEKAC